MTGRDLLRDPAESALNRVVRCAQRVADLYEDAAGRASRDEVRSLFRELAGERRRLAERTTALVRAMGELPEAPDPDREALHRLLNAARAFLSSEDRPLLEDRERAEDELADAVRAARDEELPPAARRILEQAEERIGEVRRRLRAAAEDG